MDFLGHKICVEHYFISGGIDSGMLDCLICWCDFWGRSCPLA